MKLEKTAVSFQIRYRGRAILEHSYLAPCIRLEKIKKNFHARHGSYSITKKIYRRRSARHFEILRNDKDYIEVAFGKLAKLIISEFDDKVEIQIIGNREKYNCLIFDVCGEPSEHIYGCGEQYSKLDLKGSRVPLWVEEQGIGRGKDLITFLANAVGGAGGTWYSTYHPQPTFFSSKNYSWHADTECYAVFDFKNTQKHKLEFWGYPRIISYQSEEKAAKIIGNYTKSQGLQRKLPDWANNGIWLAVQGGEETVLEKIQVAQKNDIPVAAVWVQDWPGRRVTLFGKQLWWNWQPDKKMYPNLKDMIAQCNERGVRFLGYINSFLAIEGNHYREAEANGFLVRKKNGATYRIKPVTFPVGLVDLSNPGAREWIKDIIKREMIEIGMSGWMADFGEHLPTDAILYSGESAEEYHNKYPLVWAQLNREAIEEAGKENDVLFFTRAGYAGITKNTPLVWAGDQLVNWSMDDGLATVIPAAISLGFVGVTNFHADIGGYTTVAWIKRNKELFLRWLEFSAFTPVMRTHEGLKPDKNWQFDSDEETLKIVAFIAKIHVSLKPYIESLQKQYREVGLPAIRHPYVHYEDDETLHSLQYQYLFGEDLLVAPVVKPNKKKWLVYLPAAQWVHLWTGKDYGKGWCEVSAPIGQPPVFYRKNSVFSKLFEELGKNLLP